MFEKILLIICNGVAIANRAVIGLFSFGSGERRIEDQLTNQNDVIITIHSFVLRLWQLDKGVATLAIEFDGIELHSEMALVSASQRKQVVLCCAIYEIGMGREKTNRVSDNQTVLPVSLHAPETGAELILLQTSVGWGLLNRLQYCYIEIK